MTLFGAKDLQGSNEVGEDTSELFESIEHRSALISASPLRQALGLISVFSNS